MSRMMKKATIIPKSTPRTVAIAIVRFIERVCEAISSWFCCSSVVKESAISPRDFLMASLGPVTLSAKSFPALATASRSPLAACFMIASWSPWRTESCLFVSANRSRFS